MVTTGRMDNVSAGILGWDGSRLLLRLWLGLLVLEAKRLARGSIGIHSWVSTDRRSVPS